MLRLFSMAAIALAGLLMLECRSARAVLAVSELPEYNTQSADHIIFLNFRISGKPGGNERVELASANVGDGKMKDISRAVHSPYQIKAVPRYESSPVGREMVFEHPLFKTAEISDPGGHIREVEATAREGNLLVRLQQRAGLNQLELFSVSPENGIVKIYTLDFK